MHGSTAVGNPLYGQEEEMRWVIGESGVHYGQTEYLGHSFCCIFLVCRGTEVLGGNMMSLSPPNGRVC